MSTTIFTGIPVVGTDSLGNPLMVVLNGDGNSVSTSNTNAIAITNPNPVIPNTTSDTPTVSVSWSNVEITALAKDSSGNLLGLGLGVDQTGATNPLVWKRTAEGWSIGLSGITVQPRPIGLLNNGTWLAASAGKIISSDFNLSTSSPAGGFSTTIPTLTTIATVPVDALSDNGTIVVGTSIGTIGSWTSGNAWGHSPGAVTSVPTGHFDTTYTFPGYTGANAQVQYATTTYSFMGSTLNQGSYGLMGSPVMSVTWAA